MEDRYAPAGLDRRGLLRRAGLVAGAGAVLSLVGAGSATASAASPAAPDGDPDQLFQAGEFAAAKWGYLRLLHQDPGNAPAAAQLGYIALLSNRFREAESYLSEAIRLAPDDKLFWQRLAECFVRQDMLARAVPLLPPAQAAQAAAVSGIPYETLGACATRVPVIDIDPLPHLEASVNGAAPGIFVLDTGATGLTLSAEAADRAGVRAVSSTTAFVNGREVTINLGVVASLRIGQIELRNVPTTCVDGSALALPNGLVTAGTIGSPVFQHFLTTIDYRGRALILRRRTAAQRAAFRAGAARDGIRPQPLWLAAHLPCALGKINDYGPRVACIDSGGIAAGLDISVANAQRAGIAIDFDHPVPGNGGAGTAYAITADRMSIGDATSRHVPGVAGATPWEAMTGFSIIGNFTHEFFKPFAATFDFVGMNLFVG
jgi:predicted aspartyl protease